MEQNCKTKSPDSQDPCPLIIHHSLENTQDRNGNPLQYSCLENSMDREAGRAIVHGVTELGMAEWLTHTHGKLRFPNDGGRRNPCPAHHSESFLTKAPHLSGSRPEASIRSSLSHCWVLVPRKRDTAANEAASTCKRARQLEGTAAELQWFAILVYLFPLRFLWFRCNPNLWMETQKCKVICS